MIGADEAIIAAPGNLDPRRVPVYAAQTSWELSGGGAFSAFARSEDLRAAGLGDDLKGYWLTYATAAGPWGGVITGQPTTDGIVEIAAGGWLELVRGSAITVAVVAGSGSAGGLLRRALTMAGAGNPTFLTIGSIDEGGGPLAVELVGDVAADVLPQIAEAGDVEWVIDADRVFRAARKLGTDRSMTVRLVEGRQVVQARLADDLAVEPAGEVYRVQGELSRALAAFTRRDDASTSAPAWEPRSAGGGFVAAAAALPEGLPVGADAARVGYRSIAGESWRARRTLYEIATAGTASPPASSAAAPLWAGRKPGIGANHPAVAGRRHVPLPTVPVELTLTNEGGCFRAFDIGDTVRLELDGKGGCGRFRAMVKALDVASGALTVSGELLRDA